MSKGNFYVATSTHGRMVDVTIRMTQVQFGALNAAAMQQDMPRASRSEVLRTVIDRGLIAILGDDFLIPRQKELFGNSSALSPNHAPQTFVSSATSNEDKTEAASMTTDQCKRMYEDFKSMPREEYFKKYNPRRDETVTLPNRDSTSTSEFEREMLGLNEAPDVSQTNP